MSQPRIAPWPDFSGAPIAEGDVIQHPTGERGLVVRLTAAEAATTTTGEVSEPDLWRVNYGDKHLSRLALQIGDKGRAVVVRGQSLETMVIPFNDPFWTPPAGTPGPGQLFPGSQARCVLQREQLPG